MNVRQVVVGSVAVVSLLVAASCTSSDTADVPSEAPRTEVQGVLRLNGGPLGAGNPGIRGNVVFAGEDDTSITTTAGQDGRFRVALARGRYRVTGTSPQYPGLCKASDDVIVPAAAAATIVVRCEVR